MSILETVDPTVTQDAAAVRVAIVNDYELVVAGTATMLAPYPERVVVVELDSNTSVVQDVDVVLYDAFAHAPVVLPHIDSMVLTSGARLVVYSWHTDTGGVQAQALRAGAVGLVSKGATAEELVSVIERVHRGEQVYLTYNISADIEPREGRWPGDGHGLSSRESEVLALVCLGLSNEEVATRTYLSMNTVKTYIRYAYRKIGVTNRTHAVIWGLSHGFEPAQQRRELHPLNRS